MPVYIIETPHSRSVVESVYRFMDTVRIDARTHHEEVLRGQYLDLWEETKLEGEYEPLWLRYGDQRALDQQQNAMPVLVDASWLVIEDPDGKSEV